MPTASARSRTTAGIADRAAAERLATSARTPQGLVTAIVAVTGTEDLVGDILIPGSFKRTLATRRPKVVWHHSWTDFVGRVVTSEELLPGDRRLPKRTKDGQPWPAAAGAVIATMQFNMNVQAGRDAYEWVRFFTETDECEFSIGYKVVPEKTSQDRSGKRFIADLDVYEYSVVLHGAHPLTASLDVKAADGQVPGLERKLLPDFAYVEVKAAEKMAGRGVMVALYPGAETAAALAVDGGSPAEELHVTLAFLGTADELGTDPAALASVLAVAAADPAWRDRRGLSAQLVGTVGGLGQFPDSGDGAPTYIPVDVPGIEVLREHLVDALFAAGHGPRVSMSHGFTPHMTLGYKMGQVEPVPSTPVEFDSAWLVVGGERYPLPFVGADGEPEVEGKTARQVVLEAKVAAARPGSALQALLEAKMLPGGESTRPAFSPPKKPAKPGAKAAAKKTARPGAKASAKKRAPRPTGGGGGGGKFDESLHPRGEAGTPTGGQFVAKGDGYASEGKEDRTEDVRLAQAGLIKSGDLGKFNGKDGVGADGLFGGKTEAATKAWQKKRGYSPTGKLSEEQYDELTGKKQRRRGGGRRRRGRGESGYDGPERRGGGRRRRAPEKPDRYGRVGAPQVDRYGRPQKIDNPEYNRPTGVARRRPEGRSRPGSGPALATQRTKATTRPPVQRKTAYELVADARSLRDGLEAKGAGNSPRENWVDQVGGLPAFIRQIKEALEAEGKDEQTAARMAVGAVQRWARGGDGVTEATRAKAAAAVAEWESKKAQARADNGAQASS